MPTIGASVTTAPGRRRFSDEELLDAALEVFHQRGYDAAQVTDVALRAGTTKPTLYARLGNKEQIYIRVLQREAELLKGHLFEVYESVERRPLAEMIQTSTLAFFRFADRRRAGFTLLFSTEPGGPGNGIADRAMDEVIGHIAHLFRVYDERTGRTSGPSSDVLAAAGVGAARQVCQFAIDHGHDVMASGELATSFTEAALRGVDADAIRRFDAGQIPS